MCRGGRLCVGEVGCVWGRGGRLCVGEVGCV